MCFHKDAESLVPSVVCIESAMIIYIIYVILEDPVQK